MLACFSFLPSLTLLQLVQSQLTINSYEEKPDFHFALSIFNEIASVTKVYSLNVVLDSEEIDKVNLDIPIRLSSWSSLSEEAVLVFVPSLKTFSERLATVPKGKSIFHTPIFIIFTSEDVPEMSEVLRLWPNQTVDRIVGVGSRLQTVFVLIPLSSEYCTESPEYLCDVKAFTEATKGELKGSLLRKVSNVHRRKVKITFFTRRFTAVRNGDHFVGFDGRMLHLLEERLNYTTVIVPRSDNEDFGFKDENGTFYGSLGDLVYHRAHISLNGLFMKDYQSDELVFTTTILTDKLCVTAPSARPIPNWKAIFLCFETTVWVLISVSFLITSIFWYVLRRFTENKWPEMNEVAIIMYGTFLLIPLNKIPDNHSERVFFSAMMIASLLIATCFQGSLLSLLSRELYEKEITTFNDLAKSSLRISTNSKNLLDTFDGGDSQTMKVLRGKLFVSKSKDEVLDRVSKKRDLTSLGRDSELQIRIATNYTKGGRASVHIVEECPRTYQLAYLMAHGSPYYEPINSLLGRISSSGLTSSPKLNEAFLTSSLKYKSSQSTDGSSAAGPFNLEKVKIAFAFLIIGFGLSIVVFLGEVYFKKFKKF